MSIRLSIRSAAVAIVLAVSPMLHAADETAAVKETLANLQRGLEAGKAQMQATEQLQALRELAEKTLPQVKNNYLVTDVLRDGLKKAATLEDAMAIPVLERCLCEAIDILGFKPTMEASQPEGFPIPVPLGEIRVQEYPAYRMARAAMKDSETMPFFTLFKHIQKNDIAMTAPVEMTHPDAKGKGGSMAFLYDKKTDGKAGMQGDVEVLDIKAMTAVSVGVRGKLKDTEIEAAKTRLETWLKQNADQYEAAGPLRVMGYNSPFIAAKKSFNEIQIPVRKKSR